MRRAGEKERMEFRPPHAANLLQARRQLERQITAGVSQRLVRSTRLRRPHVEEVVVSDPEWAHEHVHVVPADPRWPELAEAEAKRVREALAPWLSGGVHHVGSTSVPGLDAKPILDLLGGVRALDVPARPALEALGWHHVPPELDGKPWRRFYVLARDGRRYAHIHLAPPESPQWYAYLEFPRRLREDATIRAAYAALKRELAGRHREDREAYSRAKASFIESVLKR
jgi:GrpB-like predicted nucleotidyltransferase (UPF0157 family)